MSQPDSWDLRFLGLARYVASWSKDPSTKVGACIVDRFNRIISLGYNGFPRGVPDRKSLLFDRVEKHKRTIHAEMNAILFAEKSVLGDILYTWPFMPCARCASMIIQSGIARVVAPSLIEGSDLYKRWHDELVTSKEMFVEAGVELYLLDVAGIIPLW